MTSLVLISDSHMRPLDDILGDAEGDLLIHCGDALDKGSLKEGYKFLAEWERITKRFRLGSVYTVGNHDLCYGENQFLFKGEFLSRGSKFLCNEGTNIKDGDRNILFWGHSLIPWISTGYWFGESEELDRRRALNMIPESWRKELVLISHGPPRGVLDVCTFKRLDGSEYLGPNWGCGPLREFIWDNDVPYCLSGHLHSGHGRELMMTRNGQCQVINAANVDEDYKIAYPPEVIEI